MAMSQQIQPGRQRKGKRFQPMAEINVTPMVDVMLVLLIVFMVAAPLLSVGVPVNLPKAGAQSLKADDTPLAITVTAEGKIFIEESEIAIAALVPRLEAIAGAGAGLEQRIYVRGDQEVAYGRVADVVARINAAGYARVALVTERPKGRN